MPLELQVKLLRVLESREVTRVGSVESLPVDVRIVSASNRDPKQAVASGALREDLLYRLDVFPIQLPPLRERGDDVILLAQHFLNEVNRREGTDKRWSAAGLERLRELPWPGNLRELRNLVERSAILSDGWIRVEDLPELGSHACPAPADGGSTLNVRVGESIAEVERRLILATLEHVEGKKKRAAEMLGISLKTLYSRLALYARSPG
jgi:DNA-binding NtrC family response regulator